MGKADSLEGKVQAPIVVFAEGIEFTGSGFSGVHIGRRDKDILTGFTSFGYSAVEGVYAEKGKSNWQNWNFKKHRRAEVPKHLDGTQVVFTDQVVYEGPSMGGHHFSFLKDGKYVGHDHGQKLAIDFSYSLVKAIFDKTGKPIWKNLDYKEN